MRILSRNKETRISFSDNYIDVYDGAIYQKFYQKYEKQVQEGSVFSFCLNTDGISPCSKSKKSIWPIILVINELPVTVRYCFENIVFAGKY